MEDYSQAEDVASQVDCSILFHVYDLWGDVSWSPTLVVGVGLIFGKGGQSEVNDHCLTPVLLSQHYILQFQVSMHNIELMHIANSFSNGPNYFPSPLKSKTTGFIDPIEQIASFQHL